MNDAHLIQTLTESFIALADEVQSLVDRKTILEHKLRYAHEQYQYLGDKYAVPDVSETLAKLQIPPDIHSLVTATSAVPLPRRGQPGSNQHQIALLIREGRKAVQQLATDMSGGVALGAAQVADTGRDMSLSQGVTASTVLEKDFTVQGRRGSLACPFSARPSQNGALSPGKAEGVNAEGVNGSQDSPGDVAAAIATAADTTPHMSSDPICAAMLEEHAPVPTTAAAAAVATASQCPIRFLDKHSPEEIAHYVETHKHEIPRSHEVCVRRYQRNEEQIRKLDAKYGNLVTMVEDLSLLHRPMLPPADANRSAEVDASSSNKRVEDWAQTIVAGEPEQDAAAAEGDNDEEREGRFDRPFREVRLGESPSRPWGISVPLPAGVRSDKAPVLESSSPVPPLNPHLIAGMTTHIDRSAGTRTESKKCPFDHTKLSGFQGILRPKEPPATAAAPRADTPFEGPSSTLKDDAMPSSPPQPTFINLPEWSKSAKQIKGEQPQMVFNISGPVFIGYPMEQAMQFMQQYQQQRR